MDKRPNLPSNQAIFRHWQPILANMDVCIDEGACFACGWNGSLERAHIVPRCEGGSDEADNLHLLCGRCHHDSEYITNRAEYLDWIQARTWVDGMLSRMQASYGLSPGGLARDGWQEVARTALRAMSAGRIRQDDELDQLCRQVISGRNP